MATATHIKSVSRAQVMTRAWQLAKLNRNTMSESSRTKLGWAMSYAWKEAREGKTEHWSQEVRRIGRRTVLPYRTAWNKLDLFLGCL